MVGALIFISSASFGTAVIFLYSQGKIWVAADTMQTDRVHHHAVSACKILNGGNFFWAVATPLYNDLFSGFDFSKLMNIPKSDSGTLRSKMDVFLKEAKEPLITELKFIRNNAPDRFADFISRKCLWQVAFVGFESSRRTFEVACISVKASGGDLTLEVPQHLGPAKGYEIDGSFFGIGESKEAQKYLDAHREEFTKDNAKVLRDALLLEEKEKPEYVGGEINILEISSDGHRWIAQGACE